MKAMDTAVDRIFILRIENLRYFRKKCAKCTTTVAVKNMYVYCTKIKNIFEPPGDKVVP